MARPKKQKQEPRQDPLSRLASACSDLQKVAVGHAPWSPDSDLIYRDFQKSHAGNKRRRKKQRRLPTESIDGISSEQGDASQEIADVGSRNEQTVCDQPESPG